MTQKERKDKDIQTFQFVCRGCTMQNRERLWHNFASSIADAWNRSIDNSYLIFEEEPNNPYDPNAVMIVCRGEFFGTVGYVGREWTLPVKEILKTCTSYHIDMVNVKDIGKKEISLMISWK